MRERGADVLAGAACASRCRCTRRGGAQRGFNQAADLARHLGMPVVAALRRVRATATQTGLPAAQRHRNVRDAFAADARRRARSRGAIVVLVDDVSTTGATLDACARVLKEAGVRGGARAYGSASRDVDRAEHVGGDRILRRARRRARPSRCAAAWR